MKPITPLEAGLQKQSLIPDEVIEVFNSLIVKNLNSNGISRFLQNDVVSELVNTLGMSREAIFKRGYLDVESKYEKAGWKVEYDKGNWRDDSEPTFTFRSK